MSKYSGKCDLWDTACMHQQGIEDFIATTEFYIKQHRIMISNKLDLLKYAPYLVGLMVSSNGKRRITLSMTSYVDSYECEMLTYYLNRVLKAYRKCKRYKSVFNAQEYLKDSAYNEAWNRDIAHRVEIAGEDASLEDIYLPICEMFRHEHVEDLVKEGMSYEQANNWVYGRLF